MKSIFNFPKCCSFNKEPSELIITDKKGNCDDSRQMPCSETQNENSSSNTLSQPTTSRQTKAHNPSSHFHDLVKKATKPILKRCATITYAKGPTMDEINTLVNQLLHTSFEERQKIEADFISQHKEKKTPKTYLIETEWMEAYNFYLKGGMANPPSSFDNMSLVKEGLAHVRPKKSEVVNEIIWVFIRELYGQSSIYELENKFKGH